MNIGHLEHDLFLLMLNLAQLKSPERILTIFLEALNRAQSELVLQWEEKPQHPASGIEIATTHHSFGWIMMAGAEAAQPTELLSLIRNAVQMLAIILENRAQAEWLTEEQLHLEALVAERTAELRVANEQLQKEIEERRQAEIALRRSESLMRQVTDLLPAYVAYVDAESLQYRFINNLYERNFQRTSDQIIGHTVQEVIGASYAAAATYIAKAQAGERVSYENVFQLADGTRWVRVNYIPDFADDGHVQGIIVFNYDITERKQMEEMLHEKTEELDRYFTLSLDLLSIADTEGFFHRLNPEWEKTLGYTLAELEGRRFLDLVHPEDMDATLNTISQLAQQHEILNFENRYRCKDGTYRWIEWRSSPKGNRIYAAARDITARKEAEEQLRRSEARYRQAIELIGAVPYYQDYSLKAYTFMGEGIREMTGYGPEEMTPTLWRSLIQKLVILGKAAGLSRDEAVYRIRHGQIDVWRGDYCISTRTGELRWVTDTAIELIGEDGVSHASLGILQDITWRKQNEEALRESNRRLEETLTELKATQELMVHQERLAAVGQLAAGIAHDFNNILATIVLYTQMSLRVERLSPQLRTRLEVIEQQTNHATQLVQQILDFGRRAVLERHPLSLDEFLEDTVFMLRRTLPENIQITQSTAPGDYLISADPTRIQQTVVNIALNARDAMPNGGKLHLGLSRTPRQEIDCVDCGRVVVEDWIKMMIADTGNGIPPEALSHIFEPFFTTRAPLGHGLGLAQVHGIVKQHGGHIEVQTEVGVGTTFIIYWPPLPKTQPAGEAEKPAVTEREHHETLLIVEDDAVMRSALKEALEMTGYSVLEAANGREALVIHAAHAKKIALVLSDWVMPEMGGQQWLRILSEQQPALKVLILTGHPLAEENRQTAPPNVIGWLLKPPSLDQLAEAIHQALAFPADG